eukprot:12927669-Prorocentrum_lima.AAC.1
MEGLQETPIQEVGSYQGRLFPFKMVSERKFLALNTWERQPHAHLVELRVEWSYEGTLPQRRTS